MHELYIADCILKSARESLPTDISPERIRQVEVQVGELDAVIPETLIFLFDAIKISHGMSNAGLQIEKIDILCCCQDCGHKFRIDIPLFICPDCGSSKVEVLQGRGIKLLKILVDDN